MTDNDILATLSASNIPVGKQYWGSRIAGSFMVRGDVLNCKLESEAKSQCVRFRASETSESPKLRVYEFSLELTKLGRFCQTAFIRCGHQRISFTAEGSVINRKPPLGTLAFIESPFHYFVSWQTQKLIATIARENGYRLIAVDRFTNELESANCLVVSLGRPKQKDEVNFIRRFIESGKTTVIMADTFTANSIRRANRILRGTGMRFVGREYGEFEATEKHLAECLVHEGIKRLSFFRPSPLVVSDGGELLIRSRSVHTSGFLARGGPSRNLYALGVSQLDVLLSEWWPFDNVRLFLHLLTNRESMRG